MTIKDIQYYLAMDLAVAAEEIRKLGVERGKSEVFGDALMALDLKAEKEDLFEDDLVRVLGQPDTKRQSSEGTIWEYCWEDRHGPNRYVSSTPFLVRDGRIVGLADR